MAKYLVVGVSSYDFKDETSGKQIRGTNIHFLDPSEDKNFVGFRPGKFKAPYEILKSFVTVPGIYEFDVKIKALSDGKPTVTLAGATFLSAMKLDIPAARA